MPQRDPLVFQEEHAGDGVTGGEEIDEDDQEEESDVAAVLRDSRRLYGARDVVSPATRKTESIKIKAAITALFVTIDTDSARSLRAVRSKACRLRERLRYGAREPIPQSLGEGLRGSAGRG